MREGPGKVYRVITKYDVGTTVIVQQRGTEWSQIRVGETVGWMMNEFLRFGTTGTGTGTGGESGGVGTGTVISDNGLRVWLRTTPNGKRNQLYRPGTAVTILSYGGEWHYISIGGVRGYMMSRYISVTPAPAPSSRMGGGRERQLSVARGGRRASGVRHSVGRDRHLQLEGERRGAEQQRHFARAQRLHRQAHHP